MDIVYLGHSSFRISGKNASVVTDPYVEKKVGFKYPKVSATIVTLSHDHDDHNNVSAVSDVKKVISGPGEYEIEGVMIMGYPSFHDEKEGQERGPNVIYTFDIDGVKIAHLGDLGHKLSEKQIEKLGNIDVLMVPIGGVYTIGAAKAAEVTRAIEPQYIIPMHYKVKGLKLSAVEKLTDTKPFVNDLGIKTEETPKLTIKEKDLLEGDQKIILLNRK